MPQPLPPHVGDILFCRTANTPIDRLIVWRTRSFWVHVKIVASPTTVIEAVSGGVREGPFGAYQGIARVGAYLEQHDAMRAITARLALRGRVGDRYGIGDLIDQLLVLLPGHPVVSWDRSADCSHLAYEFLDAAGYPIPFGWEGSRITPGDLATFLHVETVVP